MPIKMSLIRTDAKRFIDCYHLAWSSPQQAFLDAGSGSEDKPALSCNFAKISLEAYQPEGRAEVIPRMA
jgi:hypothetical protein